MSKIPVFDWKSTVSDNSSRITEYDFPSLEQSQPFDAKSLLLQFFKDFEGTLQMCKDRRFEISGVITKIGPDIHGNPSIALSDRAGSLCYVLFVFASEKDYATVSLGDTITCRGNYLGVTNEFGVVMKRSEVIKRGVISPI